MGADAKRTDDGWESLGDMGWIDADGYVYLTDRLGDMILAGGANIYPAEVEAAIDEHPMVQSSAVIGLPVPPTKLFVTADSKQWTEVPTAPAPQSTTLGVRFRQLGVYLAGTIHTYSTPTKQD